MATGRRYELADFIALLAGVISIGMAIWGWPLMADNTSFGDPTAGAWGFFAGAGAAAVIAVFVAQRSRGGARALLALAGLALLVAMVVTWEIGWATRLTTLVLGLAMLGASTSVGRVRAP